MTKAYPVKKGKVVPKLDPYPDWEREMDKRDAEKHLKEHPEDDNLPWDDIFLE